MKQAALLGKAMKEEILNSCRLLKGFSVLPRKLIVIPLAFFKLHPICEEREGTMLCILKVLDSIPNTARDEFQRK